MASKQIWLLDLPDACRSGGLTVTTFDGWETRSRSSGGYDDLLGIGYHHDASSAGSNDDNTDAYGWLNASDKPIGAMRLHRDGKLVVGAAGATNTMGKGGPLTCSKGTIPLDKGNQFMIAIEAANNGVGETWPKVQVDAYVNLVAALCKWYGLDPNRDIFGHFDYCAPSCPSRKIDPAGPAAAPYTDLKGTNSAGTWKLSAFRAHVAHSTHPPEPPPSGKTYTVVAGDSWWGISQKLGCTMDQLLAANPPATSSTVIHPGDVLNIPGSAPTPPPTDWVKTGKESSTPPGNPNLKKGVKHSNVTWLQAVLCSMNQSSGTPWYNPAWVDIDHVGSGPNTAQLFGDATHNSMVAWQRAYGLTADGVYGQQTANKMLAVRGK
jgi:LysM repeat protein